MYPQTDRAYSESATRAYSESATAPSEAKTLEIMHNELANITDRIMRAAGRLNMMADRAYGPQPQSAGTVAGGPTNGKPPIVDQLGSSFSYLNEVISQLESNIHRVERLV